MTARRLLRLDPLQLVVLAALVVTLALASLDIYALSRFQAAGADYSCFWAGAKTALSDPARIYDFHHNTVVQGWPLGPGRLRPYIYPPTALFLFAPFTCPPTGRATACGWRSPAACSFGRRGGSAPPGCWSW